VFQHFNLFPHLTILEPCTLAPIWVRDMPKKKPEEVAMHFLERVKIPEQANKYPGQLSGGQQQRVSIARALMNGGDVILADEPTGALDTASGDEVMRILRELHADGHTVIIVTHDPKVAAHAQRIIEVSDGEVVSDRRQDGAEPPSATKLVRTQVTPHPWRANWDRLTEAFTMALRAMAGHRLRTLLTMLGISISIGVAAVITMVAVGRGAHDLLRDRMVESAQAGS